MKNFSKQTAKASGEVQQTDSDAYFGLSEEVFKPVNLQTDNLENLRIGNCLHKLHFKNHATASKEVVHELYSEKEEVCDTDQFVLSPEDELLFEDISMAITEKEIIDLRANLQSIAQSVSVHERSFEEIEEFINGELDFEIENLIRQESLINAALASEIELHTEVDSAIEELDIMKLRDGLRAIMGNEYSHSKSVEEIDEYLNDEMDEFGMARFEDELMDNTGLAADLAFHKDVDKAIAEADVMALRASLQNISSNEKVSDSEMLGVASPKRRNLFWYAAASVIVLMVAISSLLSQKSDSALQLYSSYYQPYKDGANISRSAVTSVSAMNTALREIDKGNYPLALKMLESIPKSENDGYSVSFYSGVAFQELGQYKNAINSFSEVVRHGDNLLVEQSEWYLGLCYLRIEEREKAIRQFKSIVDKNGFYREKSRSLLKQYE